jgi:hypothetical protein
MKKDEGFIIRIVIIIIALVALKYTFDIDVIEWFKSEQGQRIVEPFWNFIKNIYEWIDGLFRSMFN